MPIRNYLTCTVANHGGNNDHNEVELHCGKTGAVGSALETFSATSGVLATAKKQALLADTNQ